MIFHRSYAVTLIATALVACGGGGGGDTTPTPATVTVTCPDDSKQTASTLDLATSACPAPTLVSITPANNATGVAPESIATTGIIIATSSALTTPASGDVTLKAGGVTVPATVTMVGTKGFKIVPSAKLLYAQAYTFLANVKDSLGKNLSVSGTFTTASVSCTAPLVPDSAGTSCVPPTCTAPAVWSGTSCEDPPAVLHYTDKVYAKWTDAYPFVVTKTGAVRVKNMTVYSGFGKDLFNCVISSYALADGKIPLLCKDLANNRYHEFYINPEKDELYEYVGSLPADLGYTLNASGNTITSLGVKWGDVQQADPLYPTWGVFAKVADGWYFTLNTEGWVLKFQDNVNIVSIVKAGTFATDGSIKIMFSYSN